MAQQHNGRKTTLGITSNPFGSGTFFILKIQRNKFKSLLVLIPLVQGRFLFYGNSRRQPRHHVLIPLFQGLPIVRDQFSAILGRFFCKCHVMFSAVLPCLRPSVPAIPPGRFSGGGRVSQEAAAQRVSVLSLSRQSASSRRSLSSLFKVAVMYSSPLSPCVSALRICRSFSYLS